MASENFALASRLYETYNNDDVRAFFSLLSPEIQVTQSPQLPWGGVFRGIEAARAFFTEIDRYLDNSIAIERALDGGERVAIVGRAHGTVRRSGRPFNVSLMHLWEFKDAMAVRLEIVVDVPAMLAALVAA